jgi:hypothetical protein
MIKCTALLIVFTATTLFPLGLMVLTWGLASFLVWDIIPAGWGFLRVGLGLGVLLTATVACDKNFWEIYRK